MVEKKNLLAFEKFSQVVSNAFDVNHVISLCWRGQCAMWE